ncbi:MAG: leucyl aminopeptidase [Chloroflexota bacterium]
MNLFVQQGGIQELAADAIIVNLFQGVTEPQGATGVVNKALAGAIGELIEGGDLTGKLGQTAVLYPRRAIPARRVIVVGLGEPDKFDLEAVREASGAAIKQARQVGAKKVATIVHGGGAGGLDLAEAAQAVVEGSLLALYRYDAPRSRQAEDDDRQLDSLALVEFDPGKIGPVEAGAQAGQIIADSVALARTLVNQPGNVATPNAITRAAQAMAAEVGLTCTVWDEDKLREQGMGALLAVNQGATQPARFIIMEHRPAGVADRPLVLVGKGVAFDTGGYALKSLDSMVGMKADMAGAAAVIAALRALALLRAPTPVVGLAPLVENMISATAYKPSDVFTAKNGVTIEVTNTDAEGRLILADALCYAGELNPAAVIDVSTLTGGKVVALGERTTALFCTDDSLSAVLLEAGRKVGEPLWRLPLDPAYDRQLKSNVADLKNVGGRSASAVTAARFLAHFVGEWPWAHLDIAGGELNNGGPESTLRSYVPTGATGVTVRTLVELARNWK